MNNYGGVVYSWNTFFSCSVSEFNRTENMTSVPNDLNWMHPIHHRRLSKNVYIPVFPTLFSCVETENAWDIYWVTSQPRHSTSHDKLVTLKLGVESEMRSWQRMTKRTERTRRIKNAKNDDDDYYYYRAYCGHSFQQHFVSLNVPHANDDNEEEQIFDAKATRVSHYPLTEFIPIH